MDKRIKDLTGRQFGMLSVLEYSPFRKNYRSAFWVTICECGKRKLFSSQSLIQCGVKSCGCVMKKNVAVAAKKRAIHGQSKKGAPTRTYCTWAAMKQRCLNPNNPKYHRYGGRGINIEWSTFQEFYTDMGDRPPGMTIERKNVNGNYSKDNCKWGSDLEQGRNKTVHHYLTHNGATKCLSEWAETSNISYVAIRNRIHRGWEPIRAITEPLRQRSRTLVP